jgi:HEAT repeat protein
VRELALNVSKGQVRVERMLRALGDTDVDVRITASAALREMPKDEGLKRRLLALTELPDWFVQKGGLRALAEASNEERERMLGSVRQQSSWGLREAAARALGGAENDVEIRDRLLGMLPDPIHEVRREAALALSVDDPVVRQRLLELTRGNPALRYDAVLFVWRAQAYPEVQERLFELTRDDKPSVRGAAVRQLNKAVGERRIRARLLERPS